MSSSDQPNLWTEPTKIGHIFRKFQNYLCLFATHFFTNSKTKRQSQNGSTSQNGTPLNTNSNLKESLPINNQQQPTHQGNLFKGYWQQNR